MNDVKDPERNRRVRKCARPISIRNGNPGIVLCIHGYTGYPGEMAYPAARLAEAGWDVEVIRLSGHGTDGADFATAGVEDWRRQVADAWLDLTSRYASVKVLGHSMGGLLALDLASRFDVDSLAVMAPAIGLKFPGWRLFRPFSRLVTRRPLEWKSDPEYEFFDDRDADDDEYLGREYWSWVWLRPLYDLMELQNRMARRLDEIRAPVLGIFAGRDSVVGQEGAGLLESRLGGPFRRINLPESRHYIPYDPDAGSREAAMDAVIAWFSGEDGSQAAK